MRDLMSELERRLDEPTARGLAHAVSQAIRDGQLASGTRLPPIRQVATQLMLSPTTVSSAWATLARAGTIRTDGRRGTTVCATAAGGPVRYRQALEHPPDLELDLSTGVPDAALLPTLTRALQQVGTVGAPQSYLDHPVLPELADVLRDEWPYQPPELTITDGAMDALAILCHVLLMPGDAVAVEHPCFPPLLDLLEQVGAKVVGVPVDEEGLRTDELTAVLTARHVRTVFLQPRGQNPTGVSTSPERAEHLARLLADSAAMIVEDDSTAAVSTSPPVSLGTWLPQQTVHVRSFSKSHGPDLRLAAVSGPAHLIENVHARRLLGQGWSSRLLQRILLNLLIDDDTSARVLAARDEYARRRAELTNHLRTRDVNVSGQDGINIWVPVRDETAAQVRLASQGIAVAPGAPFAVLPGQPGYIRVTSGLVRREHKRVAMHIAAAASAAPWRPLGR